MQMKTSQNKKILIYQTHHSVLCFAQHVGDEVFAQARLHEVILQTRHTTAPLQLGIHIAAFHSGIVVLTHREILSHFIFEAL